MKKEELKVFLKDMGIRGYSSKSKDVLEKKVSEVKKKEASEEYERQLRDRAQFSACLNQQRIQRKIDEREHAQRLLESLTRRRYISLVSMTIANTPHTCVYKALQAHKALYQGSVSATCLTRSASTHPGCLRRLSKCLSRRLTTVFESFSQLRQTAQHLLNYTLVTSPSSSHIPLVKLCTELFIIFRRQRVFPT